MIMQSCQNSNVSLFWTRLIVRLLGVREFILQSTVFQKYNATIQLTNNKWPKFQILGVKNITPYDLHSFNSKGGGIAGYWGGGGGGID